MRSSNLILFGAGGHARACIDVIESAGVYSIIGLVGRESELRSIHCGYEVIGRDDFLDDLFFQSENAFIGVGQILTPNPRIELYKKITKFGFKLPSIISPNAYVSPKSFIGQGSLIMHGAIVNAGAYIGNNCIINTRSLIEHDCCIEDHCHISTGAILNGGVTVGAGTFIGSSAVLREGITIGERLVISMGSVINDSFLV